MRTIIQRDFAAAREVMRLNRTDFRTFGGGLPDEAALRRFGMAWFRKYQSNPPSHVIEALRKGTLYA